MAGEEAASVAMSAAQKSMEITAELIKMIAPTIPKIFKGALDITRTIEDKAATRNKVGNISRKELFSEAGKAGSTILSDNNFLVKDAENIAAKSKQYKIPVSIIGDGDKVTLSYLERDKAIVNQILQETMQERLKTAPQEVEHFLVSEQNVHALKKEFVKNGVECCFAKNSNGQVYCQYQAKDAERVSLIKEEFKAARTSVEMNCKITPDIPENETQIAIKSQIAELKSPETRSKFYEELSADENIEFPVYSEKNMERVYEQMPDATRVAGKAFWESKGYTLNENAKGVEIVAPQMDDKGNPVLDENGKQTFTSTTVYDISETDAFEKSVNKKIAKLQSDYDAEKIGVFNSSEDKKVIVSDELSGKSVEINVDRKLHRDDVSEILRDKLGYSSVQADIAANKMCFDLGLDKEQFFSKQSQRESIDVMRTNIRFESDDVLLKNTAFNAVRFADGEHLHIWVEDNGKSAYLTPATMSREEMKKICVNNLDMSEEKADEVVEKTMKIDTQLNTKDRKKSVRKSAETQTVEIDRTSNNSFSVKVGSLEKTYDFTDKDVVEKIGRDFGIKTDKAESILEKAKSQSAFANNIDRAAKSSQNKSANLTKDLKENLGKGVRK